MTEGNNMYMPVAPAYGGGGYGNGMFGGDGWWVIILLAVLGWGRGFGGGYGDNCSSEIQNGFNTQNILSGVNDIRSDVCNGFAGVNLGVANGFAAAEANANARQMADMNQYFQMQSAFQNCCCENRLATANLTNTVTQEAAATRASGAANTQAILDKLCQLELDGVKQNYEGQIRVLQTQLNSANTDNQALRFAASQIAQNGQITDSLYNRLATCPVPCMPVYGMQPIFTCNGNNNGCGCGNNYGYAG